MRNIIIVILNNLRF